MPKETLLAALKRKFHTPEEALSKLGIAVDSIAFDEALANSRHYRLTHDQETTMSAEELLSQIKDALDNLPDEERTAFAEGLAELLNTEPANAPSEAAMDRQIAARRRARLAQDEAKYRPMTTADQRRFNKMFPSAARIGIV